ncbi:unnamed protein product [Angiostrongylus costaricensis]|uniref:Ig-like domain-containing protein n=1 Tax=Angiostrongylus costaricensis TaxID=334426 RepID=A0A158PIJ0_ANGCS|nr:unnamed protein product [Angiostrongylus costaricensis]
MAAGRLRIGVGLTALLLLVNLFSRPINACEKEIEDDVCPQREGFDKDCEQRCQQEHPHRLSSACHLRSTGTLLSFFGIKSFICKCKLPGQFCNAANDNTIQRRSFSLQDLTYHSTLVPLSANAACTKPTTSSLSCRDDYGEMECAWQRSEGNWYVAEPRSTMPFAPDEAPSGALLCGFSKRDSKNLAWAMGYRSTVFQISIVFTNITDGDVVLLDDVTAQFNECSTPTKAMPLVSRSNADSSYTVFSILRGANMTKTSAVGKSVKKPFERRSRNLNGEATSNKAARRRFCKRGKCMSIVHAASTSTAQLDRMCVGRIGVLQCREKCWKNGVNGKFARCIRQHESPFIKRCLCHMRRSPLHRVDGGSYHENGLSPSKNESFARKEATDVDWLQATTSWSANLQDQTEIERNEVLLQENVCARKDGNEMCNRNCKASHINRWLDMNAVYKNFGNFIIASKHDQR